MTSGRFRFDRFVLDPRDRQLKSDDLPVELNTRYFDALALLLREQGKLVSKDRFLEEVWRGVPVTEEALTQCIRTLRRQLGDDAARPRFIETVVKHGYRFIAPVEWIESAPENGPAGALSVISPQFNWNTLFWLGGAGTLGAGLAGLVGGLLYGFAAGLQPTGAGMGTVSVLLVVVCLSVIIALLGGAGVSLGIAAASYTPVRLPHWKILGGAVGGMIVGAVVKLLGLDAFNLLFGEAPDAITGAPEGALLGGAVGLGVWLGARLAGTQSIGRSMSIAALTGGIAGAIIPLLGGHLMAGSLVLLGQKFPRSRLSLDSIGSLFAETGFGPVSQVVTGGLEGALFGGCVAGAMVLARRYLNPGRVAT